MVTAIPHWRCHLHTAAAAELLHRVSGITFYRVRRVDHKMMAEGLFSKPKCLFGNIFDSDPMLIRNLITLMRQ